VGTRGYGGHDALPADKNRAFQPLPEALAVLHRRLKGAFDPAGILNPHRMYAEI
jgi:glycolate oxidase FAD binding subunit